MAKGRKTKAKTSTYKPDPDRRRLQVICNPEQEATLTAAAEAAGAADRSSWMLAVCLAAAAATEGGELRIPPPLAGELVDLARAQGSDPVELVKRWVIAAQVVAGGSR